MQKKYGRLMIALNTAAQPFLEMGEGGVAMLAKPAPSRPALVVPPRNPNEAFLRGLDNGTPSPMTYVSNLLADNDLYTDCKPFSNLLAGALGSPTLSPMGGEPGIVNNLGNRGASDMQTCSNLNEKSIGNGSDVVGESHGHPLSNVSARYKAMMPSRLPIPSTNTCLTIPPGLSPTMLLDSPLLLSAGLADPSPTTGSILFPPYAHGRGLPIGGGIGKPKEGSAERNDSFIFKPHPLLARSKPPPINDMGPFGFHHQQALEHADGQGQSQESRLSGAAAMPASNLTPGLVSGLQFDVLKPKEPLESTITAPHAEPLGKALTSQVSSVVHHLPSVSERPSVDGYNWKKYGQKQLKGTEYPRSYYKCTHPNCSVKKQVECSHEGEITEIMYKGEHNHAKPQATRRAARNGVHILDRSGGGAHSLADESAAEVSSAVGRMDSDRVSAELSTSSLAHSHGGLARTPEHSSGSPSNEEGEDGEASRAEDDGEDDDSSKRRRIDNAKEVLSSVPIRTIREPRVVVQTTSEVDILDDGYRWRKYGQKVVKGNRYPRSYYKCTNLGCAVRKHVERSSADPKSVITTYEGKHNHNVPVARGSVREIGGTAIVSAVVPPPLPAPAAIGVSCANMVARSSVLLEKQEVGNFMEDKLNIGSRMTVDMGGTSISDYDRNDGGIHTSSASAMSVMGLNKLNIGSRMAFDMGGTSISDYDRNDGGIHTSSASAMSVMAGMRSLGDGELPEQGLGLSFLQYIYPSSSFSFVAEGPLSRSPSFVLKGSGEGT